MSIFTTHATPYSLSSKRRTAGRRFEFSPGDDPNTSASMLYTDSGDVIHMAMMKKYSFSRLSSPKQSKTFFVALSTLKVWRPGVSAWHLLGILLKSIRVHKAADLRNLKRWFFGPWCHGKKIHQRYILNSCPVQLQLYFFLVRFSVFCFEEGEVVSPKKGLLLPACSNSCSLALRTGSMASWSLGRLHHENCWMGKLQRKNMKIQESCNQISSPMSVVRLLVEVFLWPLPNNRLQHPLVQATESWDLQQLGPAIALALVHGRPSAEQIPVCFSSFFPLEELANQISNASDPLDLLNIFEPHVFPQMKQNVSRGLELLGFGPLTRHFKAAPIPLSKAEVTGARTVAKGSQMEHLW